MCWGDPDLAAPGWEELTAALVDAEIGLCARSARFTEADVVEHLCALSGGRLTVEEIIGLADRFLASDLVGAAHPRPRRGAGGGRRSGRPPPIGRWRTRWSG